MYSDEENGVMLAWRHLTTLLIAIFLIPPIKCRNAADKVPNTADRVPDTTEKLPDNEQEQQIYKYVRLKIWKKNNAA